jgi:glycosyltransferase involved in cell wall biosynthesis
MSQSSASVLSAIIPVSDYTTYKDNIANIIKNSIETGVELIVVIDNQAQDIFEEAISMFASLKGNGTVLRSEAGNPGGARNLGLTRATSGWVTFWDCDDEPAVKKIMQMISSVHSTECQVLIGSYEVLNLSSSQIEKRIVKSNHWAIDVGLNPGIWRFVFKRELVAHLSFPDLRMGEDQVFLQRVFLQNPYVCVSQQIFYKYHTNVPNQLTSEKKNLTSLIEANKITAKEYRPGLTTSQVLNAMLIRQYLTLCKNYSTKSICVRYFLSALYLLVKNPKISFRLLIFYINRRTRIVAERK